MKRLLFAAAILIFMAQFVEAAPKAPRYAVAVSAAPVLNTPDFAKMFSGKVKLDPCQGVRPIEFVALPGTLFAVQGELVKDGVRLYRVTTNDYPYPTASGYFVDARFVKPTDTPKERPRRLPELAEIQKRMLAALGKPYVWGGNVKDGVPLLREHYPKGDPLAGVDCTGLLYEANDGFTPRNSSSLTSYGEAVPVAGLSAGQIAQKLQPLDLIVWKGHVMMVLDSDSVIESRMGCAGKSGVMLTPIVDAVAGVMKTRKPVDVYPEGKDGATSFVVRRWYPGASGKAAH